MECIYYWGKGYTGFPLFLRAYSSDIDTIRTMTKSSVYCLLEKNLHAYSLVDLGVPLVTHQLYRWNDDC